jgi:L-fucose mutarotase/ribose pyranase (RbsD/FucU family)
MMTTRELAELLTALVSQGHGDRPIMVVDGEEPTAVLSAYLADDGTVSLDTTG